VIKRSLLRRTDNIIFEFVVVNVGVLYVGFLNIHWCVGKRDRSDEYVSRNSLVLYREKALTSVTWLCIAIGADDLASERPHTSTLRAKVRPQVWPPLSTSGVGRGRSGLSSEHAARLKVKVIRLPRSYAVSAIQRLPDMKGSSF
jgi:hypothetical protein